MRHGFETTVRVAAENRRAFKTLSCFQLQTEIMCIQPHLDECFAIWSLLDNAAEVPALAKCPEVDITTCLGRIAVQDKVWVMIVGRNSSSVLNHDFSIADFLHKPLLLCAPVAVHVQKVQVLIWDMELSALELLHFHCFTGRIVKNNKTLHQIVRFVDLVMQFHFQRIVSVFQFQNQLLAGFPVFDAVSHVFVYDFADTICKRHLQTMLFISKTSVYRKLFSCDFVNRIIRGYLGQYRQFKIFHFVNPFSPI